MQAGTCASGKLEDFVSCHRSAAQITGPTRQTVLLAAQTSVPSTQALVQPSQVKARADVL